MAAKTAPTNYSLLILIALASAAATAFYYERKPSAQPTVLAKENTIDIAPNLSEVRQTQGLYLFINAQPKAGYETLGTVDQNTIKSLVSAGENKNNWDALLDIGRQIYKEMTLSERLDKMASAAKALHQEADGIVFNGNLTSCEVIKFTK